LRSGRKREKELPMPDTLTIRHERDAYQRGFYPEVGWTERADTALFVKRLLARTGKLLSKYHGIVIKWRHEQSDCHH
jgi:hypothetical protein